MSLLPVFASFICPILDIVVAPFLLLEEHGPRVRGEQKEGLSKKEKEIKYIEQTRTILRMQPSLLSGSSIPWER